MLHKNSQIASRWLGIKIWCKTLIMMHRHASRQVQLWRPIILVYFDPYAVHTLNLALKNICAAKNTEANETTYKECNQIAKISGYSLLIKNFIINYSTRLAIFNEHVKMKLLAVVDTRFLSVIIMLPKFKSIKRSLHDFVLSN